VLAQSHAPSHEAGPAADWPPRVCTGSQKRHTMIPPG
jgi:hypothetical protein